MQRLSKRMNQKKIEEEIEKINSAAALSGMTLSETEDEIRKRYGCPDALKLPIEDRRKLMDLIMEEACRTADDAAGLFIQNNSSLSQDKLEDEVVYVRFQIGIAKMLELKKKYGFTIARYDGKSKQAFIEYSDGHKEFAEDIIKGKIEYDKPEKA